MKRALVIGHTGQDGFYLTQLLSDSGFDVVGLSSQGFSTNSLGLEKCNVENASEVRVVIELLKPDHVYYLAAVHQSSVDKVWDDAELFRRSFSVNVYGLINFLDAVSSIKPDCKVFYAASSHIFGQPTEFPQTEASSINPDCVYGITKAAGLRIQRFYRANHRIFTCTGILYNHESPRRESKYVTKKIIEQTIEILDGKRDSLVLADLNAKVDWGFAPDYMKAVTLIMQQDIPDDYVISAGDVRTVQEFVELVFGELKLDWRKYVKINPSLITKKQKINLTGDATKLRKKTGWRPDHSFDQWVKIMLEDARKEQHAG